MNVREVLNKQQGLVTLLCCAAIAVAVWCAMASPGAGHPAITSQDYYTDDDGQTYFADEQNKAVPFLHNGKEAVLAFVYRSGGKTSVHYMMRMRPSGKAQKVSAGKTDDSDADNPSGGIKEYKRPGEKQWHPNPPGPLPSADGKQPEWITP